MLDKSIKQKVMERILPELEHLAENIPQYGEISLKAKICNFKVGTISLGTEISRKIEKTSEGE